MQTIELECPTCKSVLELDAGFAGGVCRCSGCGTLMTVPSADKPVGTRGSRPDRPGRPDAPMSASSARTASPARAESPARAHTEPPAREEAEVEAELEPEEAAAPAGPIRAEAVTASADGKTFRTASGKVIQLANKVIPNAKVKRKVVRYGIIVIFVVVMAVLIVGTVVAVVVVSNITDERQGPGQPNPEAFKQVLNYDPDVNPFKLKEPTMLGVPMAPFTVVVIDASQYSSAWITLATEGVKHGFKNADKGMKLQIIVASEMGMKFFPEVPGTMAGRETALNDFLSQVTVGGVAQLDGAIVKALEGKPEQVILISSQPLQRLQADEIGDMFLSRKGVHLDIISVGREIREFDELTRGVGGQYYDLPETRLIEWYHRAQGDGQ